MSNGCRLLYHWEVQYVDAVVTPRCNCWCFFFRFYIIFLELNRLQLFPFNYKEENLIMQIECFWILLLPGMEFLRIWVMWKNWYGFFDLWHKSTTLFSSPKFSLISSIRFPSMHLLVLTYFCLIILFSINILLVFHISGSWVVLPPWDINKWKFNWFRYNTIRRKAWYVKVLNHIVLREIILWILLSNFECVECNRFCWTSSLGWKSCRFHS